MEKSKQDHYSSPVKATLTGILDLFRKQEKAVELLSSDRLDGKTVLVGWRQFRPGTGSCHGMCKTGSQGDHGLQERHTEKGELVKKNSGSENVHMLPVDFADIRSIQKLVSNVKQQFSPIDILVCNAGIVPKNSRKTLQGTGGECSWSTIFPNSFSSIYYWKKIVFPQDQLKFQGSSLFHRSRTGTRQILNGIRSGFTRLMESKKVWSDTATISCC